MLHKLVNWKTYSEFWSKFCCVWHLVDHDLHAVPPVILDVAQAAHEGMRSPMCCGRLHLGSLIPGSKPEDHQVCLLFEDDRLTGLTGAFKRSLQGALKPTP